MSSETVQKIIPVILLLLSLPSFAQDYSHVGKKITYSETLKKAKKYTDIDKALEDPSKVYYLNIVWYGKDASLQKLSDNIGKFANLRKLIVMNYGSLTTLSADVWKLKELEYLALFNFPGMPVNGISQLQELKFLSLDGFAFNEMPPEILELPKLEYLDLSCNRLSSLPAGVGRLSSLKEIELTNNCFTAVPKELGKLQALQYLTLNNAEKGAVLADGSMICNNSLTEFPAVFQEMKFLKKVSCFFKVDVDPVLKKRIISSYPGIKFK